MTTLTRARDTDGHVTRGKRCPDHREGGGVGTCNVWDILQRYLSKAAVVAFCQIRHAVCSEGILHALFHKFYKAALNGIEKALLWIV